MTTKNLSIIFDALTDVQLRRFKRRVDAGARVLCGVWACNYTDGRGGG